MDASIKNQKSSLMAHAPRPVDPNEARHFSWGSIQWLASDTLHAGAALTFGHVEIKAGAKNPLHVHPNCDEVLFLVEGTIEHSVSGEVMRMTPGTSVFIPRDAPHDARNIGDTTARMVVAYSTGDRQTTMIEEGEE